MPREQVIRPLPEDSITMDPRFPDVMIRVRIPGILWELAGELAKIHALSKPQDGLRMLLRQLASATQSNPKAISRELVEALERVKKAAALRAFDVIDVTKLHRNDRTKSGYEGVYVNGQGFRAMAADPKDPRAQVFLGLFDSAESAAWARYQHYQTNKLPYGEFAAELDRARKQQPLMNEEDLIDSIVWLADITGTSPPNGLDIERVELARQRAIDNQTAERARIERDRIARLRMMGADPGGRQYPRDVNHKPIFPEDPDREAKLAERARADAERDSKTSRETT